jgi:hypothetical protein
VGRSCTDSGWLLHRSRDGGGDSLSQILTISGQAGKLKNWKSEKTDRIPPGARLPGFQDFSFPPLHLLPENLAG